MLYLIEILHQTTTVSRLLDQFWSCILSKFYIKPQHPCRRLRFFWVVSYRNSTSNHNAEDCHEAPAQVVSYRNSTSNHNSSFYKIFCVMLYLIEILHQTTTPATRVSCGAWLYLIEILHQTTTQSDFSRLEQQLYLIEILHQTTTWPEFNCAPHGCILSKFYIKPQLAVLTVSSAACCILSKFYIKPQRVSRADHGRNGCILSKFYIKPQHALAFFRVDHVVSYRNSTSNHNVGPHIDW